MRTTLPRSHTVGVPAQPLLPGRVAGPLAYLWAAVLLLNTLVFKSCKTLKMKPHCPRTLENGVGKLSGKDQTRSPALQATASPALSFELGGKSSRTAWDPMLESRSYQTPAGHPPMPDIPGLAPWSPLWLERSL